MTNEVIIFNNLQFGDIRTAGTGDNPQFCLSDVCRVLGLTVKGVNQRLDKGVISTYPLKTAGGVQQAIFVNEDGLYDVILDSRKPEAKAFRKWVTSEVLPSIRKSGGYNTGIPNSFAEALRLAADQQEKIDEQNRLLAEQAPKVAFANAIEASKSSCLIGELAKIITQNGYEIGQNRLFGWMRSHGYLGTKGERYNIPNQQYVEQGLFEMKKGVRSGNDGVLHTTITTKVTGKGQSYFINKFISA